MEGKPRESLVLFDNPIEVSTNHKPNDCLIVGGCRSLPVSILTSHSRDSSEVSQKNSPTPHALHSLPEHNRVTVSLCARRIQESGSN